MSLHLDDVPQSKMQGLRYIILQSMGQAASTRLGELVSRGGGRWGVRARGTSPRCAGVTSSDSPFRLCIWREALSVA